MCFLLLFRKNLFLVQVKGCNKRFLTTPVLKSVNSIFCGFTFGRFQVNFSENNIKLVVSEKFQQILKEKAIFISYVLDQGMC